MSWWISDIHQFTKNKICGHWHFEFWPGLIKKIKIYNLMLFLCGIILWAKLSSIILMWNLQSTFYDIIIALQFLIKYVRTASDFCCQTSLHCNLVVTVGAQYIDETDRPFTDRNIFDDSYKLVTHFPDFLLWENRIAYFN